MNDKSSKSIVFLLGLLWLGGWQTPAGAHGVALEYQPLQTYRIKATYDSGKPMAEAQVAVFAPDNAAQPWLKATTDGEGQFLFNPPAPGNWEVRVRQGGHGNIIVIPVAEPKLKSLAPPESRESSPVKTAALGAYTPLQKGVMIGAVLWGCLGTALFFTRKPKPLKNDAHS